MLCPPKIRTIRESENKTHPPNNRWDCSKKIYLHPNWHHAIVSIPQELQPSMTGHTSHTNAEPEKKVNIKNLVCDCNHSSAALLLYFRNLPCSPFKYQGFIHLLQFACPDQGKHMLQQPGLIFL